ncbi:GNAT family N-acetyltransferase [Aliivibrio kagoshimensis]|uniref:GNAT family N-acetyltransferase n=1 Tax=Aliivibrio kagoshimensis TaxID=2910230 RepID=UPI003D112E17
MNIERLDTLTEKDLHQLSRGLMMSVEEGASLGFLKGLSLVKALNYWNHVAKNLSDDYFLLVAKEQGEIIGSVQLEKCDKENGLHRAEVQKLFVLPTHRRKNIASQLMIKVSKLAYENSVRLMVLDTQTDSKAEQFYQQQEWKKSGEIPHFALSPEGQLCSTSYYYKIV